MGKGGKLLKEWENIIKIIIIITISKQTKLEQQQQNSRGRIGGLLRHE